MTFEQLNLIDVLRDRYGVALEKRGHEYWASCPFHEDSRPSFSITDELWYCFSCKSGGLLVDFVSKMEHVSRPLAKNLLTSWYNIERVIDPNRTLLTLAVDMLAPYHDFLEQRGVSRETAATYNVGYCDSYQRLLEQLRVDEQEAAAAGLFDITGCLVFPFIDAEGCFRISTRSVSDKRFRGSEKTGAWKHSLWGLDQAKSEKVFLFEGYFDVLIAHQHSIPAVALSGTTIHLEYWKQLHEYGVKEVVVVPDGDFGGRELLKRVVASYDHSFHVTVVALPSGDPDESIVRGDSWLQQLPLEWYAEQFHPTNLDETVRMYHSLSQFYCKLAGWERHLFKAYFAKKFDAEALDYLIPDVKPDWKSERTVIANCLYSDAARVEALQDLDEKDFTLKLHRNVFDFLRHNPANPALVEKNFGADFTDSVELYNFRYYIDEVKKTSVRVKLYDELERAKSRVVSDEPDDIVGGLTTKMLSLFDHKNHVYDASEVAKSVMNDISAKVANPRVLGISLGDGFPMMNRSLLGFVPRKLLFVSGPTGHGKTTLLQNWIDNLVFNRNEPVLFFTLEMTPEEIVEKQIAIRTGISGTKILTGSLEQLEYDAVFSVARQLLKSRLKIVYGTYDLYKIANMAKALIRKDKYRVVFIDYLQLVTVNSKLDRWQQLMEISSTIKRQLCNELDVTVIAASQLGKASLNSAVAEVKDVAGSYGMLADADVAMSVRQIPPSEIDNGANFELYIDKHRYGRDKILIPAVFDKGTCRIKER